MFCISAIWRVNFPSFTIAASRSRSTNGLVLGCFGCLNAAALLPSWRRGGSIRVKIVSWRVWCEAPHPTLDDSLVRSQRYPEFDRVRVVGVFWLVFDGTETRDTSTEDGAEEDRPCTVPRPCTSPAKCVCVWAVVKNSRVAEPIDPVICLPVIRSVPDTTARLVVLVRWRCTEAASLWVESVTTWPPHSWTSATLLNTLARSLGMRTTASSHSRLSREHNSATSSPTVAPQTAGASSPKTDRAPTPLSHPE